jgi:PelA/Pel-15E family pectate lyase
MRRPVNDLVLAVALAVTLPGRPAPASAPDWKAYGARPDAWYAGAEGTRVAANILSHQSARGDWPKNTDTTTAPSGLDPTRIQGTFDNGATVGEVRFLAGAFRATLRQAYREAVVRSLDHVLRAQYPTGGWPQSDPPGKGYHRHITFNDGTMVNLTRLVRDAGSSPDFAFLDADRRRRARAAFQAATACILKCQVEVGGVRTVWCAQHDETTLEPRPGRTFEPVSLSGGESAGVLIFLMSLENPGPEVVRAVEAGVRWFEATRLMGIRQESVDGNKVILPDKGAPPLWARFYEIGTNRPIFCDRDGVVRYELAAIGHERRNGYAWYGTWGGGVLRRYARWKETLLRGAEGAR